MVLPWPITWSGLLLWQWLPALPVWLWRGTRAPQIVPAGRAPKRSWQEQYGKPGFPVILSYESQPQPKVSSKLPVNDQTKTFSFLKMWGCSAAGAQGRVTSYGAIANYLGTGLSARMVGWAMNAGIAGKAEGAGAARGEPQRHAQRQGPF